MSNLVFRNDLLLIRLLKQDKFVWEKWLVLDEWCLIHFNLAFKFNLHLIFRLATFLRNRTQRCVLEVIYLTIILINIQRKVVIHWYGLLHLIAHILVRIMRFEQEGLSVELSLAVVHLDIRTQWTHFFFDLLNLSWNLWQHFFSSLYPFLDVNFLSILNFPKILYFCGKFYSWT